MTSYAHANGVKDAPSILVSRSGMQIRSCGAARAEKCCCYSIPFAAREPNQLALMQGVYVSEPSVSWQSPDIPLASGIVA